MERVLVTGSAGFIGHHLTLALLDAGCSVVGLDSLNDYYPVQLKLDRLKTQGYTATEFSFGVEHNLAARPGTFVRMALEDAEGIQALFAKHRFTHVVHLAAQAGVRYSLENPRAYIDSNITGTFHILEACRQHPVQHLLLASSSSVYGNSQEIPFQEAGRTDAPISLYAASKKSNEVMAHSYAHLFRIPTTCLRFFTVYGPWGRPDMAIFLFTQAILQGKPIKVFNYGNLRRDFTYVGDIVSAMVRMLQQGYVGPDSGPETAPFRLYNIGNSQPVLLMDFIRAIESATGHTAICDYQPMQPGDVYTTYADTSALARDYGYQPTTTVQDGVQRFVEWYASYYRSRPDAPGEQTWHPPTQTPGIFQTLRHLEQPK